MKLLKDSPHASLPFSLYIYIHLERDKNEEVLSKYNLVKKEAKKATGGEKFNAYESLYEKLDTEEREIYIN